LASRPKPTARKLLVADFQNTTGDPNFDHILNQALQIDLEQSPYFAFVSRTKTRDTLTQMQRDKDEPLIGDLAREVCERNNSDAMLSGSIARLGHKYLVTMDATDCTNGNQLLESKKVADTGDDVLGAVDAIASDARRRLGESRSSVKQYSVPLFEENTGSLEALKAYSKADQLALQGKYMEAVPLFQRAIELDPKFADAYFDLANSYNNLGDHQLQIANLKKAYELRESADEPDRLYITAAYHSVVTGDLYEALRNYQTWKGIYPQQSGPWGQIAGIYIQIGQPELAIEPARHALSLNEKNPAAYVILAEALMHDGQLEAAKVVCLQAVQKKLDGSDLHDMLTQIAYAMRDTSGVDAQIAWAKESPEGSRVKQDMVLIAFAQGQGRKAQELMRQSTESYRRDGMVGLANLRLLVCTRPLSEEGLTLQARKLLDSVPLADLTNPMVAMAETGEMAQANSLLKQAMERHPLDTLWQNYRAPQIRAAVLLAERKPQEAIEALRTGIPYDLRDYDLPTLRGQAYLAAKQPDAAELECRKVLDHPGLDPLSYEYPLAHLRMARAYAMDGNFTGSRSEYKEFFTLWKDADADLPILLQAHREYSQLPPSS
jgi:tetratricopeptide (TPR) repeat protein